MFKNFRFSPQFLDDGWLALAIGNSRLHWGWFAEGKLQSTWDTPHLDAVEPGSIASLIHTDCQLQIPLSAHLPCYIASVVPSQTALWQQAQAQLLSLSDVPLTGLYPTMGIDRALALWGAATKWKLPALVLDAGTAFTFTGADAEGRLVGGAISPGLQLQMRSLTEHTAALPLLNPEATLPPRWATSTPEAIQSGILYMVLAGVQDFIAAWITQFPDTSIVLTGGDSVLLWQCLKERSPELSQRVAIDPHLIFWGMQAIVEQKPSSGQT
ncbi:MAG TPA: pantothenate kinase [Trichocoleus sp.]